MNIETAKSIAQVAIQLASKADGSVSRGKAFGAGFERFETQHGKAALTDKVKKAIREEIDNLLKDMAVVSKSEVVTRITSGITVNSLGDVIQNRRLTLMDTKEISVEQEALLLSQKINDLRYKVARKENGATESDIRQERKLKNAFFARTAQLKLNDVQTELSQRMLNYAARLAGLPVEVNLDKPDTEQVTA